MKRRPTPTALRSSTLDLALAEHARTKLSLLTATNRDPPRSRAMQVACVGAVWDVEHAVGEDQWAR